MLKADFIGFPKKYVGGLHLRAPSNLEIKGGNMKKKIARILIATSLFIGATTTVLADGGCPVPICLPKYCPPGRM